MPKSISIRAVLFSHVAFPMIYATKLKPGMNLVKQLDIPFRRNDFIAQIKIGKRVFIVITGFVAYVLVMEVISNGG